MNKFKKTMLLLLSMAMSASLAACISTPSTESSGGEPTQSEQPSESVGGEDSVGGGAEDEVSVTLAEKEQVEEFATKQLQVVVIGSNEAVVWASSDPTVATVDQNGVVEGLTKGTTTITATVAGISASCELTVVATTALHEVNFSVSEVSVYEGFEEEVEVSVSFNGELLEGLDLTYAWNLVEGDEDVVKISAEGNGAKVKFIGLKVGTVTYEAFTTVRGYETYGTITITVLETETVLGINNEKIGAVSGGYATEITLDATASESIVIGDVFLVVNGVPNAEQVFTNVQWSSNDESIAKVVDGAIVGFAYGTATITGTTTYEGEELSIVIAVSVKKAQVVLEDTMTIETISTSTIEIPATVKDADIEKVTLGANVFFDKAAGKGAIDGKIVTIDNAGMPTKMEALGEGKTLTIETATTVYTMFINVYTMIINTAEELDQWQAIAAQNAVDAGLCIEEQKGLVYSGYFKLGNDIAYNKVWKNYLPYAGVNPSLYSLCYQNKAIWNNEDEYKAGATGEAGQLKEGAIQEDWGAGNKAVFKGVFDGDGYVIEGLETVDKYSAFVITMGVDGVIKDVSFTKAKIGAICGLVADRGNGTLENIYVEVVAMESGNADVSHVFGRGGNAPQRAYKNLVADLSAVDFKSLNYAYVVDLSPAAAQGVYVIGVGEDVRLSAVNWEGSTESAVFWHHNGDNDVAAAFVNSAALIADETHGAQIKTWDTSLWTVTDNFILPAALFNAYKGNITITNEATEIPAASSFAVTTDKPMQYMSFALKTEVKGVSIEGNVVSIADSVPAGTSFTVVVTSMLDGSKTEKTFTSAKAIIVLEESLTVEVIETKSVTLPESVKGTVSKVSIGSCTVFEGSEESKSVPVTNLPVQAADLGKGIEMRVVTSEAIYVMNINVYTMIIDTKEELDTWQSVAADNSVKAGLCVEEQKNAVLSGYFILGDNIEYNGTFKPLIAYGTIWGLVSNPSKIQELQTKYAGTPQADLIINEDWSACKKNGFRGVFDGDGHYINGMQTSTNYSAFIINLCGGTVKNVAFTNASIGAGASLVSDRGPGTIENVYVEVNAIESGASGAETYVITRWHSDGNYLKNIIVDMSKVNLDGMMYAAVANLAVDRTEGLFVIGAEEWKLAEQKFVTPDALVFLHLNLNASTVNDYDIAGCYATVQDLFASEHADVVKAWAETGFWTVDERGMVLPISVLPMLGGDVAFTNEETEICAGGSLALATDKDARYIVYGLKEAVEGITVEGNKVVVANSVAIGTPFTVVATSMVDGKTVEKAFTVGKFYVETTAEKAVSVELGAAFNGTEVTKAATANVDLAEIIDSIKGQKTTVTYGEEIVFEGVIDDARVEISLEKFDINVGGEKALVFSYETTDTKYAFVLPVVINNQIELNSANVQNVTALQTALNAAPYGNFVLTSDLNMGGAGLKGVENFYGVIDGNGYSITNAMLTYSVNPSIAGNSYAPLWILNNYGTIKNIGFELVDYAWNAGSHVRGLTAYNFGTISNVYVTVNCKTTLSTGSGHTPEGEPDLSRYNAIGVIGKENAGMVENCIVEVTSDVALSNYCVAGLFYKNRQGATMKNSYVISSVQYVNTVWVQHGTAENINLVADWFAVNAKESMTAEMGWNNVWTVSEEGQVSFGAKVVFENLKTTADATAFYTNPKQANEVTVQNAALTAGEWKMTVNGEVTDIIVSKAGEYTLSIDPTKVANYKNTVIFSKTGAIVEFNNVIAVTGISTAKELQALGVGGGVKGDHANYTEEGVLYGNGNSYATGNDKTGYYMLTNDIDCSGIYLAAGYNGGKSYFKGVFDGNGYTVSNVIVSEGGIFGGMHSATVKNVNFVNVAYHGDASRPGFGAGYNNNKQYGQYFGLFAHAAWGLTVTDVNVQITEMDFYPGRSIGIFMYKSNGGTNTFTNINVDATGVMFENVLSSNHSASDVYSNFTIKAAGYAYVANKDTSLAWPEGVSFVEARSLYYFKSGANENGEQVPFYTGDVTALGFAAGTTVYESVQDIRTGAWNAGVNGLTMEKQGVRVTKLVDQDYVSIQFSISRAFSSTTGSVFTAWWINSSNANRGLAGYLKANGTYTAAAPNGNDAPPENFKIVVCDMNGNAVTSFEPGKAYEMRWYGDDVTCLKIACMEANGEPITIYYANPTSGNDA